MSLTKLIFSAIVGITLCIAIVLFATRKHVPAIVLVVCALVGVFALWKWSAVSDLTLSVRGRMRDTYNWNNQRDEHVEFDVDDDDWAQ